MFNGIPQPGAFVDPAAPLDWSNPLNRGLIADYTIIRNAGWRGGLTLRDLVRGGKFARDGTLTSGPKWAGSVGRPGGYGSLSLVEASSQYVTAGLGYTGGAYTYMLWLRGATAAGLTDVVRQPLTISTTDSWGLSWTHNNSTFTKAAYHQNSGGTYFAAKMTSSPAASVWTHVAVTWDGTDALKIYVNGFAETTTTGVASVKAPSANLTIGRSQANANAYYGGGVDGVRVYTRAISPAEMAAQVAEDRRGNPERFRWVRGTAYSIPQTVASQNDDQRRILLAA